MTPAIQPAQPAPQLPGQPPGQPSFHRRSTYALLRAARVALLGLELALLAFLLLAAHVHRHAMETVGQDAAPSILAAQHIKSALADLDANEANELLMPPNTASAASAAILARRDEAEGALLAAAENVTYPGERKPIETLQQTGEFYNRLAQEGEDLHDAQAGHDLDFYRAEATLIDSVLLPAADELDRVNNEELQTTYRRQSWESGLSFALVALAGVLLLGGLLAVQLLLSERTHRTLNPFLLMGTLLTLALLVLSLGALGTEQHQLRVAKEDSFESLHALWRARALAYQANAAESRFLLDPLHAPDYARAFQQESRAVLHLPAGVTVQEVLAHDGSATSLAGFTGLLADEWNNITFHGEREAAARTIEDYADYMRVDGQIRQLEAEGKHEEAVALCLGEAPGQSDWAFARFDDALSDALAINQREFDHAVQTGLDAVGNTRGSSFLGGIASTLELKAFLLLLLIAICTVLGFAPRIREYE